MPPHGGFLIKVSAAIGTDKGFDSSMYGEVLFEVVLAISAIK